MKLVAPSVGDDPGLRAWLERDGRLGAGPARAKELHHVYLGSDVRSFLGQVKAPVAVLQPARILRGDPGQARHLVEHLADAELRMLDSADHLPYLADADAVLDALDAVVARSARPDAATPEMLRALLGVNPESAGEIIRRHGPQAVFDLDHAVVAVFGSLASARQCAEALVQEDSEATTVVEARDTSCTADDPAVAAVAAAVRAARPA